MAERQDEALIRELVGKTHSCVPDALARHPQPLKLQLVDERMAVKDATNELLLTVLQARPHSEWMMVAYLPGIHTVVQADLFDSVHTSFQTANSFAYHLRQLYTDIERHVPLHGEPLTQADLIRAAQASPP